MIYLIIYLIGCVIAYVIVSLSNDYSSDKKYHGEFVLLSWFMVMGFVFIAIYKLLNYIAFTRIPTLKYFKKK